MRTLELLELERTRTLGFAEEYRSALRSYIFDASAPLLQRAREIGPIAIVEGVGSLEIVNTHNEEMVRAFGDVGTAEEIVRLSRRGATFLAETLAPIESTQQNFHEAIATIRLSEERYRNVVEMADDVVCALSPHGIILSLNAVFSTHTGFRREEHLGKSFVGLLHHDDMSLALQTFDTAMKGDHPEAVDIRIRTALSGFLPMEFRFSPLRTGKQPEGVLAIGRACAGRKEVERHLSIRAMIADHTHEAMLVCKEDGTVRAANKAAECLLGWTAEQRDKSSVTSIVSEADKEKVERAIRDAEPAGSPRGDLIVQTKDGRSMSVSCSVFRSVDPTERDTMFVVSFSEPSTASRGSEDANVDRRMERLGRLTSGIVHRLNDVFSTLVLGLHSLPSQDGGIQTARSSLEQEVRRGAHLVRQLMHFDSARPQENATFSTESMIDEIHAIVGQTFPRNVFVEFGVPLGLWDVRGDRSRLQQGCVDMCLSARDRLPGGGTIVVTAENIHVDRSFAQMQVGSRPGPYVCFTVSDLGHTPAEPSVRSNSGSDNGRPTDPSVDHTNDDPLGELAASMGGFYVSSTEPGKGTRKRLYVPAFTGDGENKVTEIPADRTSVSGGGHVVLIVDDEPGIRNITRSALMSYGYEVMTATDGADAVTTFADNAGKIEVVVTDLMMPYMGGATAIRAMRQIDPNVRIIATSGAVPASEVRETFDDRSVMFLPKPYNAADLVRTINAALDGSRALPTTQTRVPDAISHVDEP